MSCHAKLDRVLFGTDRRASILAIGAGVLLGLGAGLAYPLLGVEYWLGLLTLIDWLFFGTFTLIAAGIAFERAGLLASWWVNYPAHVAISYYYYGFQSGTFVVLPFENEFLFYLVISAAIAFLYGSLGYFLGTVGRWGVDRSRSTDGRAV